MAESCEAYDYIIVGAGPAGCVLANRLTEDPETSVVLLEAGGWDKSRWIGIPLGVGRIAQRRLFDWGYSAEPQVELRPGRHPLPRGKIIGGTSSINSMTYVRGNRGDYDRWAANGLPEWSYACVLPYFKRQESWEGGATEFRGADGPIRVQKSRYRDDLVDAYITAAQDNGHPFNDDYNAQRQDGVALVQSTISQGRRVSAASAYLRHALDRPNLRVKVSTQATQIILSGRRAVGVECIHGRNRQRLWATREVVICGGAINSPQLLMVSGIGAPEELARHGIPVMSALPGVGANHQDHVAASVGYVRKGHGPLLHHLRLDRIAFALVRAELFGTGFAADVPSRWLGFVKTQPSMPFPDIQLLFRAGSSQARPYLPFDAPANDEFACRAVVLRPESRGTLTLASADPLVAPIIRQNMLAGDVDRATLRAGLRIVRGLAASASLRPFVERETSPGPACQSDDALDEHINNTVVTADHPVGTCKMGTDTDPMAVVDARLRVRGVDGLRVVDASVMPDLIGGNIIAAVYMIAERAADLIRNRSADAG